LDEPPKPFWRDRPLEALSPAEWEALCDGCGRCCLNKIEDEDTGAIHLTRLACALLESVECCEKVDESAIEQAWIKESIRRLEALRTGVSQAQPWDEVKARLLAL